MWYELLEKLWTLITLENICLWESWLKAEEKGTTEAKMVGWHHWFDGHEFEQAPGVGDGHGSPASCRPRGPKESDTTEPLNWTEEASGLDSHTLPKSTNWYYLLKHFLPCISQVREEELMFMPQYTPPIIYPVRNNYPCVHKFLSSKITCNSKTVRNILNVKQ